MAARVGSPVSGTADAASGSIAASAKSTTTGNAILVFVKWENPTTPTLTDVQDTAGNTYVIDQQAIKGAGDNEPHGAIAYCMNATGNASNVVTANFSAATATFRRIIVEEFSGLAASSPIDGTSTNNSGNSSSYSTGNITTTQSGLVFAGVAGFTTLSGETAAGTPTFSLGDTSTSDTFDVYLISGSGQTVSPAASSSTADRWVMLATAFKDSPPPVITAQPQTITVYVGQTATFNISATGTGTLHYQWKDDGSNVGTDSSTYAPTAALADNGSYITCVVTDDNGSTTSKVAILYVLPVSVIAWTKA